MTKKSIDKKLELQLRGLKAIFEKRKADLRNIYNAILSLGEFFRPVTGYNTGLKLFYDKDGGRIELTNNGLVMIKELKDRNNNAVAKSLLKLGKGFAEKFGDGSKRLIILIADLMEVALELMGEGFHPNLIIKSLNKLGLFIESLLKSLLFSIETDKGTSLVKDDRGRPNIDINGAFMGANKNEKIGLIFEAMRSLLVLLENRAGKEKNVATVEYERKLLLSTLISQYNSEAAEFLADQTLKLYQNIKSDQSSNKFKGLKGHQKPSVSLNILGNFDPDDYFKFILIPGHSISEIDLLNGIVLDKEEKFVENFPEKGLRPAKILISGEKLYFEDFKESDRPEIEFNFEDNKNPKNNGTTRNLGLLKVGGMGDTYNRAYQSKADKIIKTLKELGVNLLVTEKGIDKNLEARLINEGIYYLRRIKLKQLKQLSRYLGIEINQHLLGLEGLEGAKDLNETSKYVGIAKEVKYIKLGKDKRIIISKDASNRGKEKSDNAISNSNTILIKGPSWDFCKDIKESIKKSLILLYNAEATNILVRNSWEFEDNLIKYLRENAYLIPDKTQYAILQFISKIADFFIRLKKTYTDFNEGTEMDRKSKGTTGSNNAPISTLLLYKYLFSDAIEFLVDILRVDQIIPFQRMPHGE